MITIQYQTSLAPLAPQYMHLDNYLCKTLVLLWSHAGVPFSTVLWSQYQTALVPRFMHLVPHLDISVSIEISLYAGVLPTELGGASSSSIEISLCAGVLPTELGGASSSSTRDCASRYLCKCRYLSMLVFYQLS